MSRDDLGRFAALLRSALHNDLNRNVRAIAEEAGEVLGAYNKMTDGRTDKPRTAGDIMHEMAQTIGMCFVTALDLGYSPEELLARTERFMHEKAGKTGIEYYSYEHTARPLDGHDDLFRCSCGEVFASSSGFALCPQREAG
jgi:hypothetical protein